MVQDVREFHIGRHGTTAIPFFGVMIARQLSTQTLALGSQWSDLLPQNIQKKLNWRGYGIRQLQRK
jgi:hypothetical protein